jgi:hypothetical protein
MEACHPLPEGKEEEVPLPRPVTPPHPNNTPLSRPQWNINRLLPHIPPTEVLKRAFIFPFPSSNLVLMIKSYHSPEKAQVCPSHNSIFLLKTTLNPRKVHSLSLIHFPP